MQYCEAGLCASQQNLRDVNSGLYPQCTLRAGPDTKNNYSAKVAPAKVLVAKDRPLHAATVLYKGALLHYWSGTLTRPRYYWK